MTATVIQLDHPLFKIADTEVDLATGAVEFQCQMTAATLTVTPNNTPVPATGCQGPTETVGIPSYALDTVDWLQDWTDAAGMSRYAQAMNGEKKWVSFTLDSDDPLTVVTAEVTIAAGTYGGTFGTGAAVASARWPINGVPTFPAYTAAAAAVVDVDEAA